MIDFNLGRFLLVFSVGMLTTVGFDAIFHGLSHTGHGILDRFWKGESIQRTNKTVLFGCIVWHIVADIFIALCLTIVVITLPNPKLSTWLIFGSLFGCLMSTQWMHIYAVLQISGRISIVLSILTISQTTLATIIIGWFYYGV